MAMKALGLRTYFVGAGAAASAAFFPCAKASPTRKPSISPPPAAVLTFRKLRRDRSAASAGMAVLDIVPRLNRLRGVLDRLTNAHIGSAAADVSRHGRVDVGVVRVGRAVEQRRRRHDLAGLAIAALHDFYIQPCFL